MEKIDFIVKQPNPPIKTNVLWLDTTTKELKSFNNGEWKVLTGGGSSPTEETLIDISDMTIQPFTPTDITDRIPENFKPSHLTQLKITGTESDEDGNPIIYTYCNCDLIKKGNEYCLLFNALFNIERIAYFIKPDNNKWVVMKFEEFS